MIKSPRNEWEEQRKFKVLNDELYHFQSFAKMEETKLQHVETELEEVRMSSSDVAEEMRSLKSHLADAKMELKFYRTKMNDKVEISNYPIANRVMKSNEKVKILLIGTDGLRPDSLLLAKPSYFTSTHSFSSQGTAYTFHMDCGDIPVSGPSWATLLTGKSHHSHGVLDNNFESLNDRTLFANIKTSKMFASSWDGIPRMCAPDVGSYVFHSEADTRTNDEKVVSDAVSFISNIKNAPEITFVYLNHVDRTGHVKGFGPHVSEYMDAVHFSNAQIERLMKCVQERRVKRNERWIVILTTDHGGTDRKCMSESLQQHFDHCTCGQEKYSGVHGMKMLLSHRQTFFIVCGDGVRDGEILPPPLNTDVKTFVHDIIGV